MKSGNGPATTTWQVSTPTTASAFSAVCYWAGLEIHKRYGVPVGLIQATHDGTNISEWQTTNGGTGADYLAMVRPIQPYAVKGVGWYQGESNGGDAAYEKKLTDMIAEWRADWGRADLPFGIVQLPGSGGTGAREGQFNVSVKVPNTFLVVTSDLPGGSQLHPTEKKPIGLRMGIGARGTVYGEPIVYSGPVRNPTGSYRSGNRLILKFDFAGSGLIRRTGTSLVAFQITDSSNRFQTATATIIGPDLVEVYSSRITTPTRVRYGYGTVGNLSNSVSIPVEGGASTVTQLPASQFDLTVP
jgi:sialate O-acetylesterase